MPGLLYYIPNRPHAGLDNLAELGLAYAFEQDCSPRAVINAGPDGGAGVILADSTRTPTIGHYRERQEWLKIPGSPCDAWVGRYTDAITTPEDLARAEQLGGHEVELADGQRWIVPIARAWGKAADDSPVWCEMLPQRTTLDDDGNWTQGGIVDRYAELWRIACQFWDQWWAPENHEQDAGETRIEFDFAGSADAALAILATNYRLARAEVALLGLFDDGTPVRVLKAVIDFPGFLTLAEQKKTTDTSPAAGD